MVRIFFNKKIENLSAILPQGTWQPTDLQLTEDEIGAYAPFNDLTIFNNSGLACEVRFQGGNESSKGVEFLPAGSALKWDRDEIKFYKPVIFNKDTSLSVAANEIIMQIRKVI